MIHTLQADSINLEFDNRRVLSDIYLQCETGKITGLLGKNGQGKTCLMKIIYGSLKCDKSVRFDNTTCLEAFQRPDLLLYLPQFNFIPKSLTLKRVFQDFDLSFTMFTERFPEFISKCNSSMKNLAGGERRMVELYVIVKSKAKFAMLDEPFTHLDPIQIEKVKELLIEEKQRKGLLITDHMFRHIVDICDNMYVLTNGRTHLTKSVDDLETLGYARL